MNVVLNGSQRCFDGSHAIITFMKFLHWDVHRRIHMCILEYLPEMDNACIEADIPTPKVQIICLYFCCHGEYSVKYEC